MNSFERVHIAFIRRLDFLDTFRRPSDMFLEIQKICKERTSISQIKGALLI